VNWRIYPVILLKIVMNIFDGAQISGSVEIGEIRQTVIQQVDRTIQFYELSGIPVEGTVNFLSPEFCHMALQHFASRRILILSASPQVNSADLPRQVARALVTEQKYMDYKIFEVSPDLDLTGLDRQLCSQTSEPRILILPNLKPNNLKVRFSQLHSAAQQSNTLILVTTESSAAAWQASPQPDATDYGFIVDADSVYAQDQLLIWFKEKLDTHKIHLQNPRDLNLLFELPKAPEQLEALLELLRQKADAYSGTQAFSVTAQDLKTSFQESGDGFKLIQQLYNGLSQREKLLALGLGLFDNLFEDQFFAALECVVADVWQKRDSSLQALDYEDLLNLQDRLFRFLQTKSSNRQIELKGSDYRYLLFKAAWGSHQRRILNALPTLQKVAEGSINRFDAALYGTAIRRQHLRTSISETLSDVGRITVSAVEDILIELAITGNYYLQEVSAYAIARWHDSEQEGIESDYLFLDTLSRWAEVNSRVYDYASSYVFGMQSTEKRNKESAQAIARQHIQSTLALIVSYAASYDPRGHLHEKLIVIVTQLLQNSNNLVRDRVSYQLLPNIVSTHFSQLEEKKFFQRIIDQGNEILIDGLGISFAAAYQTNPDAVLAILEQWKTSAGSCPRKVNAATLEDRDAKLLTLAKTYGEIQGDAFPDRLSVVQVINVLCQLLSQEKHPKVRDESFQSIEMQLLRSLSRSNNTKVISDSESPILS
jgi:hypothetical protein